nr:unnamed protein product [Digitaria exilis]
MEKARLTPFPREQTATRICLVSRSKEKKPSLHVLVLLRFTRTLSKLFMKTSVAKHLLPL